MKRILLLVAVVLAIIIANVSLLWAIVELIIYLVKDDPFNWYSVWLTVIGYILSIGLYIISVLKESKHLEAKRELSKIRNKKSKWQERLDEAVERKANTQ